MRLTEFQKSLTKDPRFVTRRLAVLARTLVEVSTEALALGYSLEELADIASEEGLLD